MKKIDSEKREQPIYNDEFDLLNILKIIWSERINIIKTFLVFLGLGLFVALTSNTEYSSNIVVKPILSDADSKLGGGLSGLAAVAGISVPIADNSAEIHPILYPKIIESYSFQKELIESLVSVEDLKEKISFERYYEEFYKPSILELIKKYSIGLPKIIIEYFSAPEMNLISEIEFNSVSSNDYKMMRLLEEQLTVSIDEDQGFVELTATMPEKVQATQLVINAHNILQRKVIEHKLKKAKEDLGFIEERYEEKKILFEQSQKNLAKYRDANKNVNTATALTEIERLESEYDLAFSVYSELAKQVESQKIKVMKNTPVFVVLKEAVVPLKKSSTSRLSILLIWGILGVFIGISNTFIRDYIYNGKYK